MLNPVVDGRFDECYLKIKPKIDRLVYRNYERKSIKANAILNIIRIASSILLPMISYPYISRILGPIQLGKVDFATSIISYFSIIAGLGIPNYGIICCSKVRNDRYELKKQ